MTTCAACGESTGRLDLYRDVARAAGWSHAYAHLDCARYRVRSIQAYRESEKTMEECGPGLYRYVWLEIP